MFRHFVHMYILFTRKKQIYQQDVVGLITFLVLVLYEKGKKIY